ncbi:D-glycero-beta-D-manno-heptose 1-phosphate adenylyltransferase [candidate division KSB1 bacterium]|nr:D-glycero-beta-D-manno-heptose 1-phosphate adenylyltransferase [candidate division KSB1 bacterium]
MPNNTANKIVSFADLLEIVAGAKAEGRCVVWSNGCFDILHAGHVEYLERAAALGDILIVGVNSDTSVKKTKGAGRPIMPQDQRARLLAALACVDYVVLYDQASPLELIGQLRPDIYAKGGDYNVETINQDERKLMESLGGRIELLPGVPGISTSKVIERIIRGFKK